MTILVVGDSFSFGSELSDLPTADLSWQGNCYFDPDKCCLIPVSPSRLSWPALLGNRLSVSIENLSLPGSSNDRIFRKAMMSGMIKKYDLIICAWTCVDRFDFSWKNEELQLSASNPMPNLNWFKEFVTDHYDPIIAFRRWFVSMIALQAFFKLKKQPYLFVNAVHPLMPFESLNIDHNKLMISNQIDHNNYIDWKHSLYDWCQGLPFGPGGHFLEEGHLLVANRIADIIQQNKYCNET
jgi:hypothetical protein